MAASNIINVTQGDFQTSVVQASTPVLVDFWAEWCGPCKMIAPILDELAAEYDGKVTIAKVDIEKDQSLAATYGITAIPTLLLFKNGQVTEQITGLRSKRELKNKLDQAIS